MEPMTGPLRRIKRAKKHLNVLNREIKSFIAGKPYRCAVNKDPNDGRNIYYPYLTKPYPLTWGFLVGEVAHGLRSSLDNIAWALAVKRDRSTAFPIYIEDGTGFARRLKQFRKDAWDDAKAVQPYNAPNGEARRHPLWVLSIIDNIDKHRLILPSVTKLHIPTGLAHPKYFWMDGFVRLNKGSVQFKLTTPANLQKDFKPEITGQVLFDISSPIPDEADDPARLSLKDLFVMHHFVRNDVYPRFAKLLEPEDIPS